MKFHEHIFGLSLRGDFRVLIPCLIDTRAEFCTNNGTTFSGVKINETKTIRKGVEKGLKKKENLSDIKIVSQFQ